MKNDLIKYFKTIGEINNVINAAKRVEEIFGPVLKIIQDAFKFKYATIWFRDENNVLHPYCSINPLDISGVAINPGETIVGETYKDGALKQIIDFKQNPNEDVKKIYGGVDIKSYIAAPIENRSGTIGVIEFINDSRLFNEEEANILSMITTITALTIDDDEKYQQPWADKEKLIVLKDINKSYKNGDIVTRVLKGINLDVYRGEFVVLLGESGCGKSTLLNIVGGMETLDSGSIVFDGVDMSHPTENELTKFRRDKLGFIFQSYNLMPNLNIKENLDLIGNLVEDPLDSLETLDLVGLKEKAHNYPSELSGGQQQRVSIARALVKKPILILADEPTAALDYETSIEVLSVLEDVYKNGSTLLMVTHNEEIAKMADRVVRFRGGKVHQIKINRYPLKAKDLVW